MGDRNQIFLATPAWFAPVVGLPDTPLGVPSLGLSGLHEVMVFDLAAGLFVAMRLCAIVFSRLIVDPPLPAAQLPTLMILVAPLAVGFSAYFATTNYRSSSLFQRVTL